MAAIATEHILPCSRFVSFNQINSQNLYLFILVFIYLYFYLSVYFYLLA